MGVLLAPPKLDDDELAKKSKLRKSRNTQKSMDKSSISGKSKKENDDFVHSKTLPVTQDQKME
jgi:hypothetical protein